MQAPVSSVSFRNGCWAAGDWDDLRRVGCTFECRARLGFPRVLHPGNGGRSLLASQQQPREPRGGCDPQRGSECGARPHDRARLHAAHSRERAAKSRGMTRVSLPRRFGALTASCEKWSSCVPALPACDTEGVGRRVPTPTDSSRPLRCRPRCRRHGRRGADRRPAAGRVHCACPRGARHRVRDCLPGQAA